MKSHSEPPRTRAPRLARVQLSAHRAPEMLGTRASRRLSRASEAMQGTGCPLGLSAALCGCARVAAVSCVALGV